jgi:hypothetical protein
MKQQPWMCSLALFGIVLFASLSAFAQGKDNARFAWLSFAPEVGYVHFFESKFTGSGEKLDSRHGTVVKGHVDLGGDGLALEIAPLYAWQSCDLLGNFHAVGGEVTLALRGSFGSFYPGIGIGFHGSYLFNTPHMDRGTQLYARVPLGFTWYFVKYLGLVFEAGVMYGGTGIQFKESESSSSSRYDAIRGRLVGDIKFASGFGLDLLLGLRFP